MCGRVGPGSGCTSRGRPARTSPRTAGPARRCASPLGGSARAVGFSRRGRCRRPRRRPPPSRASPAARRQARGPAAAARSSAGRWTSAGPAGRRRAGPVPADYDREVRRRPDREGADPPVGAPRGAVAAAGVCSERRPRRQPAARRAVLHRSAHGAHGSAGVTGASEPNASVTPAAASAANGFIPGPLGAQALGVHALPAAPRGVEHRLHARHRAAGRKGGDLLLVGHLGVLDPVRAAGEPHRALRAEPRGGLEQRAADRPDRIVADRVEPGLDAGLRARHEMVADLLLREISRAAARPARRDTARAAPRSASRSRRPPTGPRRGRARRSRRARRSPPPPCRPRRRGTRGPGPARAA